ncbi:MAG: BspA family leucine-rich repeat surface protein [Cyclobacteriaceae bacterium]
MRTISILTLIFSISILTCCSEEEVPQLTLTVTPSPEEGGAVTIEPVRETYEPNETVTLTAVPHEFYEFVGWSGDVESDEPSVEVVFEESNITVLSTFQLKDTDGDGVTDDVDSCEDTPAGEAVDENGCSDSQKDTDGDGVTDDIDSCEDTPVGETADENGCGESQLTDTDGDGVVDAIDECPNTETGVNVSSNGCNNPIYLDSNGVTINAFEWAEPGDIGTINGINYTIVSGYDLRSMIDNNEDVSNVVTTFVSDMSGMFSGSSFNGDLTGWDVSNVTNIWGMFRGYSGFDWDGTEIISLTPFNGDLSNWDVSNVTYCSFFSRHPAMDTCQTKLY